MSEKKNFDALLKEVIGEARALRIPVSAQIEPEVAVNARAKRRFGCCRRRGLAAGTSVYTIELSAFLADAGAAAIKQTLAHEVLHTCRGCGNHGPRWNRYAGLMNAAYGYDIRRTAAPEELGLAGREGARPPVNYVLVCQRCGARFERSRQSRLVRQPQAYRCRCGGALKRVK